MHGAADQKGGLVAMNDQTQDDYWNGENGELWARKAEQLDAILAPFLSPILERVAQHSPKSIMDVGCGAGALTLACAEQHSRANVTGVDLSKQLLAVARKRATDKASGAIFFKSDATSFSIGEPVEAMVSRFGMMFFPDPLEAFVALRAKMAPSGAFVGVCWQSMDKNDWLAVPLKSATPHLKEDLPPPDPAAPGPFAFADAARTRSIFEKAGWSDVALTPWTGQLTLPGTTVEEAANFSMELGPLASVISAQNLDAEAVRGSVEKALAAACPTKTMFKLNAAVWIVTARA